MAETVESLIERIATGTQPGFRGRLAARGMARGMIWTDGQLPANSPQFANELSADLLSYGLSLVGAALRLRVLDRTRLEIDRALEHGGEAIESVVRHGDPQWQERGFYAVIAAAAYHIGHFSARAFSLLSVELNALNLSPAEHALVLLMRRDLDSLRAVIRTRAGDGRGFDEMLAAKLKQEKIEGDYERALQFSLDSLFHRAFATFDYGLEVGDAALVNLALAMLDEGIAASADADSVPFWWSFTIARHLLDDLWDRTLHVRLADPTDDPPDSKWTSLRQLFISLLLRRHVAEIDLWPSQLGAASRILDTTDDLVAALPTSAGKTRIAELCILRTLALGRRIVFVTPLRALSAQTERTLRQTFAPLGFAVSSLYGSSGATADDIDSLGNREIVVSTPEKLDFALRNNPDIIANVGLIVLDEAHSIGVNEREIRYEVLVQRLLRREDASERRIVCLSAILPEGPKLDDFVGWIRQDQPGDPLSCDWRPTRQRFGEITVSKSGLMLTFRVEEERPYVDPFVEPMAPIGRRVTAFPNERNEYALASAWRLVRDGGSVLIYCPQRRSVEPLAEAALDFHKKGYLPTLFNSDPAVLHDAITIGREWLGENHPAVRCVSIGVAVHHGQLPRPFQRAVERLLRDGHLKITIASPTLAQGLNLGATTVLFFSLYRSGQPLLPEEFGNVAGRAGRAFVDVEGQVLCIGLSPKELRVWRNLVTSKGARDLRSGLVQLVTWLSLTLAQRVGTSYEQLAEYVLGNTTAWDAPPPTRGQEDLPEKWKAHLANLDSALLSLVRHDASAEALAETLDAALQSSLWQRSLHHHSDPIKTLARAVLLGRAGFIWAKTTPSQRKGYFFAGLSFDTGQYLDQHAAHLNHFLQSADAALQAGAVDQAVASLAEFGKIVFAIEPFRPAELPENWPAILHEWLKGNSMADLAGGQEVPLRKFIEDALVYRLVWALEAIRVRAAAMEDAPENSNEGRAALAVETGTPSPEAAILIQSGLPSRIAALSALRDCRGNFGDLSGLRDWLGSEAVVARTIKGGWPTPDTASLWQAFLESFRSETIRRWQITPINIETAWYYEQPASGTPVRVAHDEGSGKTLVYTPDWLALGEFTTPLRSGLFGVFRMRVSPKRDSVYGTYTGPRELRRGN